MGAKEKSSGGRSAAPKVRQKSPAEFFSENKTIAGFDNPGKALYTTVRELVENGLDSAEAANALPEISVHIEEISTLELNSLIGLDKHVRVDESMYDDFYDQAKAAKAGSEKKLDGAPETPTGKGGIRRDKQPFFYKVTCRDNGQGMPHDSIPEMFGIVLSGTKYNVKQTRGKFGLGAKMALIWSKMTTGFPIEIRSRQRNSPTESFCKLDIDIFKNRPNVHLHEEKPASSKWVGAEVSVVIEGSWSKYRSKILRYFKQLAVITPYAQFQLDFKSSDNQDRSLSMTFLRRTDAMPEPPKEAKYHPSAVDLLLLKRLLSETKAKNLKAFFTAEFSSINKQYAERLIGELGTDFSVDMPPSDVNEKLAVRIHQLFKEAHFDSVTADCLSPAGEYNLRLGVMKEMKPDLVATSQVAAGVYEGHPFLIEAAVSLGGKGVKPGINVFRFANRIPLLFEAGNDVCTKTATTKISWTKYKISQQTDKTGVFVSIVSTKVPFKGTGKEYIGGDIKEIAIAVRAAIMACCSQLKSKITRQLAMRDQTQRKKNLKRYIPDAARAVFRVLNDAVQSEWKSKSEYAKIDLVKRLRTGSVNESALSTALLSHVEQVDTELALEYQTKGGGTSKKRQALYLGPWLGSTQNPEKDSTLTNFNCVCGSFNVLKACIR